MILDFKEIREAHKPSGYQEEWEYFAQDFLELLGFATINGPDRGPDDGKDLLMLETRTGVQGETNLRWIVSCKHKAHSGTAVGSSIEEDIPGRVLMHKAQGFVAFYSTTPSASLARKLHSFEGRFEVQVYSPGRIESILANLPGGIELVARYMPESASRLRVAAEAANPDYAVLMSRHEEHVASIKRNKQ